MSDDEDVEYDFPARREYLFAMKYEATGSAVNADTAPTIMVVAGTLNEAFIEARRVLDPNKRWYLICQSIVPEGVGR